MRTSGITARQAQAKVNPYQRNSLNQNLIGEQTLSFPQSSTSTFSATAGDGNEHQPPIVVDDNQVKESNKLNNSAVKVLYPEATYDLEILASDISLSTNTADMYQDVKITSRITNKGTMNAYNVQVKYYLDDPATPFELATQTVDIASNATITHEYTWRANKAGVNMPLTILADRSTTCRLATNNKASVRSRSIRT
jgi:subtilase family serine protease